MEYDWQDFTGIHVWYDEIAWVVEGHDEKEKTVTLFNPEKGKITVPERAIKPRQ